MAFDVIVVGAGTVGGSIAYELSTRGLNVCRVGETDRTNAASKAAGAMNGCFGEVTSSLLASDFGKLKLDMDRQAQQLWSSWAERLAISSGDPSSLFTAIGTHVLLNTAGMDEVDSGQSFEFWSRRLSARFFIAELIKSSPRKRVGSVSRVH